MQRPTGVTILAILWFIGAGILVISALVAFAGGSLLAQMLKNAPGMGNLAGGLVAVVGVIALMFAALYAVTGYGLWALKNWGRILALVLTAIGLLLTLVGLAAVFANFGMSLLIWQIIRIAICAWIIWYLLQPTVKQAFGQTA
jgi:uncharacterized membrane protein (DUF2068 family)